jgi:hypothetical protein
MSNNDNCKLSWDNSRYTNPIEQKELERFTEKEYKDVEKHMDMDLLHMVSEQRCRPFGCRLENCLNSAHDLDKCMILFRQFNYCKEFEYKKVKYQYLTTGKQPTF